MHSKASSCYADVVVVVVVVGAAVVGVAVVVVVVVVAVVIVAFFRLWAYRHRLDNVLPSSVIRIFSLRPCASCSLGIHACTDLRRTAHFQDRRLLREVFRLY